MYCSMPERKPSEDEHNGDEKPRKSCCKNRIVKAAMMQKQVSDLEKELKNMKARLNEVETKRNRAVAEVKEAKELANA
ncbi:hypothetical protein Hdeb2414_s0003g00094621 [Helianthus debilis subsp. tardiflorus]